jgi:DNA invertase Pin-like site-specific DNA recombinase
LYICPPDARAPHGCQTTPVLDLPDGERNLIGPARVSTHAQDAQLQQDALALAGCGRVYVEKMSTRKAATERPGLTAALDYLRRGDTLVV